MFSPHTFPRPPRAVHPRFVSRPNARRLSDVTWRRHAPGNVVRKVMTTLRLVLGDQLNPEHGWFSTPDDNALYVLMEIRQETDYVLHHAQKIIAIFAAMRAFAAGLQQAGHRVAYIAIDDP